MKYTIRPVLSASTVSSATTSSMSSTSASTGYNCSDRGRSSQPHSSQEPAAHGIGNFGEGRTSSPDKAENARCVRVNNGERSLGGQPHRQLLERVLVRSLHTVEVPRILTVTFCIQRGVLHAAAVASMRRQNMSTQLTLFGAGCHFTLIGDKLH